MFLSPKNGIVNQLITMLGGEPIYFLANEKWWRPVFYVINRWKETGWGTITFIAALAGVDQGMHEAARIDGAPACVFYYAAGNFRDDSGGVYPESG